MRLDHESILAQRFKKQWRGYDCKDVDTYLQLLANDFKEMKNELIQLQREVDDKNKLIDALRAQTERLRQSLPPPATQPGERPPSPPREPESPAFRPEPRSAPPAKKVAMDVEALKNDIIRLKEEKQKILKTLRSHSRGPGSGGNP